MTEYTFSSSQTDAQSIQRYAELLSLVFPETNKYTAAFLDWQYAQNPDGPVRGMDAFLGTTLAAHYVTIPLNAVMQGKTYRGLLSLNTATHPQHQGKKLFTRLAELTYEAAALDGFDFVIGVANANSTPGFIRKLGFTLIAPLDVKIGVGKFPVPTAAFSGFEAVHTPAKISWKLQQPGNAYYVVKGGEHPVLYTPTSYPAIDAQMGVITSPHQPKSFGKPVTLWIGLDPTVSAPMRFVNLPERFKPSPLNLIFKSLNGMPVPSKQEIRFGLMDFDAY